MADLSDSLPVKRGAPAALTTTVEEAIQLTGVGRFHWMLAAATGMCSASVVVEIITPSYLLSPAAWATCDLRMDAGDRSLLGAIVFIGMLVGTHSWGVAADSWGRVPLLRFTLLADAAVAAVSSLLPDKRLFLAARFFNGFLAAAPTSTGMAYLGEFHAEASRAKAIIILGLFPGGATLVVAGLAYLILPMQLSWTLPWLDTPFRPWRLFVLLNALTPLLTGLAFVWLPESPRFLLSAGRAERALDSLRTVYALNKGRGSEFPVGALVTPVGQVTPTTPRGAQRLLAIWSQTVPLFRREHLRNTLLLCTVMFAVICGANGVLVWLPEIFGRMATFASLHPGQEASACEAILGLQQIAANASSASAAAGTLQDCGGVLQDAMFINTGIIGVSNVLVGLLGVMVVNLIGKRNLLVGSLVVAGVCGGLMTQLRSPAALLALACGLVSLSTTCISGVVAVAVENYPTVLRATAVSLCILAGRAGSMTGSLLFGVLLETQCVAAFLSLGSLLAACGVLSLLLPRRGLYAR